MSIVESAGLCCDVCGYSRRGLPDQARCPECGEAAPQLAGVGPVSSVGSLTLTPSSTMSAPLRTAGERLWLRLVAAGLFVLLYYWIAGLEVSLVMPVGSFSLGVMNYPGPKLNGMAPIQRSLGGQPGNWGVSGTVAMLLQVLGIWLITERRTIGSQHESLFSLRRLTRWTAVITSGGLLGAALSGSGDFLPAMGNESGGLLLVALLLCELPANALLYLHLRSLARTLGSRRAAGLLDVCVWVVPALTAAAAVLLAIDIHRDAVPDSSWHLITGFYGVITVAGGAAGTAAVLQLLASTTAAALAGSFGPRRLRLRPTLWLARRAIAYVERDAGRWCVVVGLLLWVTSVPVAVTSALWAPGREGLLGNVPVVNFIGPKVVVLRSQFDGDFHHDQEFIPTGLFDNPVFSSLVAIWLVTVPWTADPRRPWLRYFARFGSIVAISIPLGIQRALWSDEPSPGLFNGSAILFFEVPATIFVYLHLATLAGRCGRSWQQFVGLAVGVPLVAATAVAAYALSQFLHLWRHHPVTAAIGAAEIAASLTLSLVAGAALVQLAWRLVRSGQVLPDFSKRGTELKSRIGEDHAPMSQPTIPT